MNKDTLYLIDATALLYRAYYAFIRNPLINSRGMNTNAIFGVINSFLSFIQKFEPHHIIVSFDRKGPTFRHEKSDLYKANRPPMPDELIPQVEPVKQFFTEIGLPEISLEGLEADDILATLSQKLKGQYNIIIVTGDKDYCQLVEDGISLYDPMKDAIIDGQSVIARYGITPGQFVDFLAIVGDTSDNIPGVKGIGEVGAAKLLQEYRSLDGIYEHIEEITGKNKEKLLTDKANAYLSRELAQMVLDAPVHTPSVERISFTKSDLAKAIPLIDTHEMPTLKKRLLTFLPKDFVYDSLPSADSSAGTPPDRDTALTQGDLFSTDFGMEQADPVKPEQDTASAQEKLFQPILVDTMAKLDDLLAQISASDHISLDTETTGTDALLAELVGISVCLNADTSYYLPVGHAMYDNLDRQTVLNGLKTAFSSSPRPKLLIGHNLKYDLTMLRMHGWQPDCCFFDTMLAAYLIDPGINQYGLDACALKELHYVMQPITDLIGTGKNQITFDLVEVEKACFYASEDAWAALRLHEVYHKKLEYYGLLKLYSDIELPLMPVLEYMEGNGVHIDKSVLSGISHLINTQVKELTDKIYALAGYQFNINSTQQLGKLLFEEMQLPIRKKTKTGYSTDNSVLEELSDEYDIAALIMEYRQLTKLESTYVSALPKMINPLTGRVHSNFNQTIASTGRLSSSNPNLQNIPIRTPLGRQIRKAFSSPDSETVILSADYSQIELRLLAMMSRDEVLLTAFADRVDIHRQTAALISGKPLAEVTSEERRAAKVINFGILYGMGQQKLSRELGITLSEAKDIIRQYFDRFASIRDFIQNCYNEARRKHYCETIFGRRLYLPYINSSNQRMKSEAERISVNMPIQGTAADLIKLAMIDIHRSIKTDPEIRMILQVHDELLFEVKKTALDRAIPLIKTAMENALPSDYRKLVSLEVEAGYGDSWFDAHG